MREKQLLGAATSASLLLTFGFGDVGAHLEFRVRITPAPKELNDTILIL